MHLVKKYLFTVSALLLSLSSFGLAADSDVVMSEASKVTVQTVSGTVEVAQSMIDDCETLSALIEFSQDFGSEGNDVITIPGNGASQKAVELVAGYYANGTEYLEKLSDLSTRSTFFELGNTANYLNCKKVLNEFVEMTTQIILKSPTRSDLCKQLLLNDCYTDKEVDRMTKDYPWVRPALGLKD